MKKIFNAKGFTLIELLVVIAIIGILAAVVLIAIDPAERIKEANDSGVKSKVGQIQTAVESCFTQKATGNYGGCVTQADLRTAGFLKGTTDIAGVAISPATGTPTAITITGVLAAKSAKCDSGSGNTKTFTYSSTTGVTQTVCS